MSSGRCAACKYLRRRCPSDCIFAAYFPPNNPQRFASVHRIYGASNVGRMLQQVPAHLRGETAETLCYEANSRIQDPVYGCVGIISQLQQQIHNAEIEMAKIRAQIAFLINSNAQESQDDQQQQQINELESNSLNNMFSMEQDSCVNYQIQFGSNSS